MRVKWVRTSVLAAALAGVLAAGIGTASAGMQHPTVVSKTPVTWTPHIQPDASIARPIAFSVEQLGSAMYVGGRFNVVANAKRTVTYARHNLVSFDATTGVVNSFAPDVNGDVWAIEASSDAIYIGGGFTTVDGVTRPALAKLDPVTGALDPNFKPSFTGGRVTEIKLVNGRLIVAGTFMSKLVALNPLTGKNTKYIDTKISGSLPLSTDKPQVFKFAVNPDGTRLMAVGNFTTVGGVNRQRAFMLNLDAAGDTLSDWYYSPLDTKCRTNTGNRIAQLKDVDFSPDGSYFVVVATGYIPDKSWQIGTAICDAAARFETDNLSPTVPTWINYTGGDTLHSVEITGAAVYVQGHSRWLDNPFGVDSAGPDAKVRWGGGAIDPNTGLANDWDPVKKNAMGGYNFLSTSAGLWIVSDGQHFGGKYHYGIAFAPLP